MLFTVRSVVFVLLVLLADVSLTTSATSASFVPSSRNTLRAYDIELTSTPSLLFGDGDIWNANINNVPHHHNHFHARSRLTPRQLKRTSLASTPSSSTIAAGGTLLLTSLSGVLFESKISKSNGGGHVVTLLMAALLSNISQVISKRMVRLPNIPTDHFLYDWCWSIFLPASLVFALLSTSSSSSSASMSKSIQSTIDNEVPTESTTKRATGASANSNNNILRNTIQGMLLPFVAGSIGSIIGCIASYRFVPMQYGNNVHGNLSALVAGCLCASYIGGTVNFFATAKVLKNDMMMSKANSIDAISSEAMGSAFGSMAAADLVVMAIYFAMLQTASRSFWLHRLFPIRGGNDGITESGTVESEHSESTKPRRDSRPVTSLISAIVLSSSIALASVMFATKLEKIVTNSFPPPFNPPGTMCAFLALLGIGSERLIGYITKSLNIETWKDSTDRTKSPTPTKLIARSLETISEISPHMSNLCFYLLFAAVGSTADLSSAVAGGPMALAFASLALIIHSVTAVSATWFGIRLGKYMNVFIKPKSGTLKKLRWPKSSWEEVLTASNAAIGGPSTAAAFAVGLVPNNNNDGSNKANEDVDRRSALVIGATFWGVFGYAIATGIGVTISRMLIH